QAVRRNLVQLESGPRRAASRRQRVRPELDRLLSQLRQADGVDPRHGVPALGREHVAEAQSRQYLLAFIFIVAFDRLLIDREPGHGRELGPIAEAMPPRVAARTTETVGRVVLVAEGFAGYPHLDPIGE